MRLIVDTTTGLAVVDETRDFSCLDAVIIGSGQVPDYIEVLDDGHVGVVPGKLANILDLRSAGECRAFRGLVEAQRQTYCADDPVDNEKIRIRVAEWLTP